MGVLAPPPGTNKIIADVVEHCASGICLNHAVKGIDSRIWRCSYLDPICRELTSSFVLRCR